MFFSCFIVILTFFSLNFPFPSFVSHHKSLPQAIGACGLDLNPVAEVINGAPAIRVPFPKPTTELRETLVKAAKAKGEDCKGHVRQVRKLWMDKIKKQAPPKDDAKRVRYTYTHNRLVAL